MTTNFDLKISVEEEVVNGQLYFFTKFNRTLTTSEDALLNKFQVNLSRGGKKMYRLDRLSDHNGTGASWNDGRPVHSKSAYAAYRDRVSTDIAVAWANFKKAVIAAATPEVVATANGKRSFFAANGA